MNPATRVQEPLWLHWSPLLAAQILTAPQRNALIDEASGVVILLRLDTLLLEVEARTGDSIAQPEPAVESQREAARPMIEAAIRRELAATGMSEAQVGTILAQLHETLRKVRPELRTAAMFTRFVEMVDGIVAIAGPGPNYQRWRADVTAFLTSLKAKRRKGAPLDDERVLQLIAAREAGGSHTGARR
jgi:hypothetical protein